MSGPGKIAFFRMTSENVGACYCEYFGGTEKQRERFYEKDYYKSLWTWFRKIDDNGRETITISYPRGATKKKGLRTALLAAAKIIPRTRGGGRPTIVQLKELAQFRAEVQDLIAQGYDIRKAIRQIAGQNLIDPRTLKAALKRSGDLARLQASAADVRPQKTRPTATVPPRENHGQPGRHYRRSIHRNFDDVSRE
jgi:hypothetical protein